MKPTSKYHRAFVGIDTAFMFHQFRQIIVLSTRLNISLSPVSASCIPSIQLLFLNWRFKTNLIRQLTSCPERVYCMLFSEICSAPHLIMGFKEINRLTHQRDYT